MRLNPNPAAIRAGVLLAAALLFAPTLTLAHGAASTGAPGERYIQFPDTAQYQTLVVDLHTHSVFSDGHVWPRIRVAEANRDGLDALAITEHLEWQPHRADIANPDRNRAFQAAVEALGDSDLLLIAGVEITRNNPAGHINAVFINDANTLIQAANPPADAGDIRGFYTHAGSWPAQAAVEAANAQGAFMFWNHAWWTPAHSDGIARMNEFHRANAAKGLLHGIEIANGDSYSEAAFQMALDHGLALIGVSDVHDLIDWDYPPHAGAHRPVTLVLARERSVAAIREALFAKRTLVWFRNLLIARPAEMDAMLAASLAITSARYHEGTQLLQLTITNRSDARFELNNRSAYTFSEHADRLVVPANGELHIQVRTGQVLPTVELAFDVDNALTAPGVHPIVMLRSAVAPSQ